MNRKKLLLFCILFGFVLYPSIVDFAEDYKDIDNEPISAETLESLNLNDLIELDEKDTIEELNNNIKEYFKDVEAAKTETELQDLIPIGQKLLVESMSIPEHSSDDILKYVGVNINAHETLKEERLEKERLEKERLEKERREQELLEQKEKLNNSSSANQNSQVGGHSPLSHLPPKLYDIVDGVRYIDVSPHHSWAWGYTYLNPHKSNHVYVTNRGRGSERYVIAHEAGHLLDGQNIENNILLNVTSRGCAQISCGQEWQDIFYSEWSGLNVYGANSPLEAFAETVALLVQGEYFEGGVLTSNVDVWVKYPRSARFVSNLIY